MILASPRIVASGPEVASFVLSVNETASKLSDAVQELAEHMKAVKSNVTLFDVPASLLEDLEAFSTTLTPLLVSLATVWEHVQLSAYHILLEGE